MPESPGRILQDRGITPDGPVARARGYARYRAWKQGEEPTDLFAIDKRLNPMYPLYPPKKELEPELRRLPAKELRKLGIITRESQRGWLDSQCASDGWAMPKYAVMPDHEAWGDKPTTQLRPDGKTRGGKYMFPMGDGNAKRLDANPLSIEADFAGPALVFVMEGTLKNDAVLEATGLPVANVPSVTLWHALVTVEHNEYLHGPARPDRDTWHQSAARLAERPHAPGGWYEDELYDFAERYMLNRPVILVFDSDWMDLKGKSGKKTLPVFKQAVNVLDFLKSLGVDCIIAAPPPHKGEKVGIDDWLGQHGQAFQDIVAYERLPDAQLPREQLKSMLRGTYKRSDGLNGGLLVLDALLAGATPDGHAIWSKATLAERTGLSQRVITDHRPKLEHARLVETVEPVRYERVDGVPLAQGPVVKLRDDVGSRWQQHRLGDWLAARNF
jgi:hypothetical protein